MISQNGWTVYDNTSHFTRFTAGGRGWWAANADCAVVAAEFITRWDAEVESVTRQDPEFDDWSYAFRPVRGQTTGYSNHASATAWDVNATQHPRGVSLAKTFTAAQIATVHRIRASITDGVGLAVFRWGGDYVSSPIDGMHIEIRTSAAKVKQAADKIRTRQKEEADVNLTDTVKLASVDQVAAMNINLPPTAAHFKLGDEISVQRMLFWGGPGVERLYGHVRDLEAELKEEKAASLARHAELLAAISAIVAPPAG